MMISSFITQVEPKLTNFASLCKVLRQEAKLTQTQMAERLGVKLRTYQGWKASEEPIPQGVYKLAIM